MIHILTKKNILMNFYMTLQLNSLMKNKKTRWILVNYQQPYFNPLNMDVLQDIVGRNPDCYGNTYVFNPLETEL